MMTTTETIISINCKKCLTDPHTCILTNIKSIIMLHVANSNACKLKITNIQLNFGISNLAGLSKNFEISEGSRY